MLACAFLARVLRTAGASLEGVLSGTQPASLRSYSRGSYDQGFTVTVRIRVFRTDVRTEHT